MAFNFKQLNIKDPELLGGVSGKFFLRHLPVIILGIFLALGYISVRD